MPPREGDGGSTLEELALDLPRRAIIKFRMHTEHTSRQEVRRRQMTGRATEFATREQAGLDTTHPSNPMSIRCPRCGEDAFIVETERRYLVEFGHGGIRHRQIWRNERIRCAGCMRIIPIKMRAKIYARLHTDHTLPEDRYFDIQEVDHELPEEPDY